MDSLEARRYEMLTRVREFGAAHAASFPAATLGGELFAEVAAAVGELETHAARQSSGAGAARQSSTSKEVARAALREDLSAISQTARAMSFETPGLDNKFRMPHKASDQELVNTARAFATDCAPLSAEFIRYEMRANFVEDLRADIAAFEEAINQKHAGKETRVAATVAIDTATERGLKAVRRLNAIVRNKFRGDDSTLAAWTSASHVERTARQKTENTNHVSSPPS
jgi:hypothetical protein